MQDNLTTKQLNKRFDQVLGSFQTGAVRPDSEAISELADLATALEDTPVKPIVVARLTVTRAVGNITIIEVCEDATFHEFYSFYTQTGRRRSTKRLVRTANRNEYLKPYVRQTHVGLEAVAAYWLTMPGVASVKIRIIRKRAYRKLLSAAPEKLNVKTLHLNIPLQRFSPLSTASTGRIS